MPGASPRRETGSAKPGMPGAIACREAPPLIFGRSWDYKGQTAPRKLVG